MMLMIAIWRTLWAFCLLLRAHVQRINDGSPSQDSAYEIADITLAQAMYGHLAADSTDYFCFTVAETTTLHLSMLIPDHEHATGFQPTITLSAVEANPAPITPTILPPGEAGTRQGTTFYRRTQRSRFALPPGSYLVEIRSDDKAGVYCFCVGTREEPHHADPAVRARVQEMVGANAH
jgi:hypothetical protein